METDQILVVDDDEDIRETVAEALSLDGFRVVMARNGREGMALLADGLRPCLILLDMMMPVMNGWTFAQEVAGDPRLSTLPLCIFSATGSDPDHPIAGNVVAAIKKPVRLDKLLAIVKQHGCRTGASR
ncbi:MAG TPA: response regulator [Polyangia bacterium]|jgi:CheY-like chemotaxis protein|nr:response regulator [Polyangia bacterium]